MISPLEYRASCLAVADTIARTRTATTTVDPRHAAATHAVLAHDVYAHLPVPPMDNSAMDGFAVRVCDLQGNEPWAFPVVGDVPAGASPMEVPPKSAVRVMTGSEVIGDGITIIPVENTNIPAGPFPCPTEIIVTQAVAEKRHIRHKGENVQQGDCIARAGQSVDAGTLAAMVSCGVRSVEILNRLRVTVITTGDELTDLESSHNLRQAHIPDSNSPMIAQLVNDTQLADVHVVRVSDHSDSFINTIMSVAEASDLIITTGGISAGAFDVVKEGLSAAETQQASHMWFGKVAMQPGKPQGYGTIGNTMVACLPGNPVSAFVSFHLFVSPAIRVLAGLPPQQLPSVEANICGSLPTPKGRDIFVPAVLRYVDAWQATPVPFGSHFVGSLAGVNALVQCPADDKTPEPVVIPLNFYKD
ncbi:gephyrin-like molybdotransferase Glp [Corynebacterium pseudotuberculosis]|uniref:molybdopterin molybdotransferase MoeA n=1 Tax=Corynebacterium pseudotuberculosis TaxID=1719 RepID=UPI000676F030|nr:gephyrin-like molybdotransferase Glp [Corynebacterium pseudotuberculosis]AKS12726.1 Molybdopterin molybdenumtransferase [Corynebacterium pseudotuberculosis]